MIPYLLFRFAGMTALLIAFANPLSAYTVGVSRALKPGLVSRSEGGYVRVFGGNGGPADGWPPMNKWVSTFEKMFEDNKPIMRTGCAYFGAKENSDEDITHIKSSILSVSRSSSVDARFILAIVLQESNGCVRVGTTGSKVRNPGLMQSHDGMGSCGGNKQTTCSESEILLMIKDGTEGTPSGNGLMQCLAQNGGSGGAAYYKAARCYNSGSIAPSGNLGQGMGSTNCYASDIANRLLGWSSGPTHCKENTIGSLNTGSQTSDSSLPSGSPGAMALPVTSGKSMSVVMTTFLSRPSPPAVASSDPSSLPPTSCTCLSSPATSVSSTPAPLYPHIVSTCRRYVSVQPGDRCAIIETQNDISASDFRGWNVGLDEGCSNLWSGYRYCVRA